LAKYIIENPKRVASMSIGELAKATGSNKTPVARVSKLSGYKGYRDLRLALVENRGVLRGAELLGIVLASIIVKMRADDLLFCISLNGDSRDIIEALENAQRRKIPTITLTSVPKSAAAELSGTVLIAAVRGTPQTVGIVVARVPPIRDYRNNLCNHRPEKEKRARQIERKNHGPT
jgi:DNA-binding MurR/RpiR family transcriptional regulator